MLEGIELEQSPEIELGNCIVTTAVKFRKLARGNEWHCTLQVMPDLMHLEQEGEFAAHAYQGYADMAKEARLRPGDRAVMRVHCKFKPLRSKMGHQRLSIISMSLLLR